MCRARGKIQVAPKLGREQKRKGGVTGRERKSEGMLAGKPDNSRKQYSSTNGASDWCGG